jgi:phosphocarrier protein FPr/phosphocarrier protein
MGERAMPAEAVKVEIVAPLSGVVVPIDSVPDPVFARRMVGDGVAVDPTSSLVLAPVAGDVTQLHSAHHALAITTGDGLEVLIHVGLDTVALAGRGFTPLVRLGDRVERGQALLRLDVEAIAADARSLLTEVVVTPSERVSRLWPARGFVEAGRTVLLTVELADPAAAAAPAPVGETVRTAPVRVLNRVGLHARPAAVLAGEAKKFASAIRLLRGEEGVNAKSVVAIMGLSAQRGEDVAFEATGPDAAAAVARLARLVAEGLGEDLSEAPVPPSTLRAVPVPRAVPSGPNELAGAPASPGLAVGRVFQRRHATIDVAEHGGTPDQERARFAGAIREAARQIDALERHTNDPGKAAILDVQLALLEDPDLIETTEALLAQGKSAAFAWRDAYVGQAAKLEQLESALMRERAADLRDVGGRLLALLSGVAPTEAEVPEGSILISDDLTPSEVVGFDKKRVLGFCTTTGGSTSHVAILARSMGIPAVCGVEEGALSLPNGARVVIDGSLGYLKVSPDESQVVQVRQRIADQAARSQVEQASAKAPARTRDGHRIEVAANIASVEDAKKAVASGAEGVGLLRTELLFADRETAPSEDEQAAQYGAIAEVLGKDRRFIIRTLDVGGDKPLPYLPLPREQNPFLGMRGIRVSLEYPDLFRAQLRAVLRTAPLGDVHVMFPMVATLEEVRAAKQLLAEEQRTIQRAVKVGIMIEVPSAAVIVELLAREVDFFSIGTNDLTQYTLAMDRGHPKLARHADALHPAVLRMMAMTVEGAHEHGKWVGVCGGLASDRLAVPLLVGLGVDELSVSLPSIAGVKATIGQWRLRDCLDLATDVLRCRTTEEVRAMLASQQDGAGMAPAAVKAPAEQVLS